jgi:hypothetical protein
MAAMRQKSARKPMKTMPVVAGKLCCARGPLWPGRSEHAIFYGWESLAGVEKLRPLMLAYLI